MYVNEPIDITQKVKLRVDMQQKEFKELYKKSVTQGYIPLHPELFSVSEVIRFFFMKPEKIGNFLNISGKKSAIFSFFEKFGVKINMFFFGFWNLT